ncbi:maleylpyruvate isomerase N-terminal domain-containing protein [Streptomyces avermitilis]|uniref:maleylpyruvate isomerase N-terminal domain-containing protein n=1 Tax=Streptomyces avermitilis TaxID=33903 RepID=UPI003685D8C1
MSLGCSRLPGNREGIAQGQGQGHRTARTGTRVPAQDGRGRAGAGLGAPTPCGEWTVRQVLTHARLDQQAYGAAVTGDGRPESDSFEPADALSGDARAELDAVLRRVADVYTAQPADTGQTARVSSTACPGRRTDCPPSGRSAPPR